MEGPSPREPATGARRARWTDAGLALGAFALAAVTIASERFARGDVRGLDALGLALAAATAVPLLARRRAPLSVLAATTGASAALYGLSYALGPPLGSVIALYSVAVTPREGRAARLRVAAVAMPAFAAVLAAHVVAGEGAPGAEVLMGVIVWGGAWLAGDRVRLRRDRMDELRDRAERAEREARRERRLAAAEARTEIARDLHDSAGHAVNVILVQAGAARLLQERDPDGARRAIETVEEVARETIGDIDRMVHALREAGPEEAAAEPPPGLSGLADLLDRHRSSGLAVELGVDGRPGPLPPDVDRAAYRILQEALTNAARHGRGRARVRLGHVPGGLRIAVENPVGGDGAPRADGHGIVGMRERASLVGGELRAVPAGDAFRVEAWLPTGAGS